ncbi:NAD-dependent epimerase/dehydratase family protein [Spirosoma rhododendri]|uniref:NAD-dependent epimerase/dehydratase family protein n=1 Tax=Spirosoma rhododendri TaxID=2728024 RepID=A0A7L5DFW7_9BACT|nr:NAD-dependent epimerase/dehydratase family protein [Spirosoma rhododendri]QJD77009.1 NAD-dependent epimerase/dehydratase family protein [Spirosoma rhododendri]
MNTVLVTGANGFLGGYLCRELLRRGHGVRAFVRPGSDQRMLADLPVDIWIGDLLDADNVRASVYGCDYIIHAGSATAVNPARNLSVRLANVQGTATTLAAATRAGIQRYIYVGSANVLEFGDRHHPGTEQSPYQDRFYGLDYMSSKQMATDLVLKAMQNDALPALVVHPTVTLGPYDYKNTAHALLTALYQKRIPATPTGGRNYIHVGDVATATVNALTMGALHESYILGNENLSYQQLFDMMAQIMQVRAPSRRLPRQLASLVGLFGDWRNAFSDQPGDYNSSLLAMANDKHYFSSEKAIQALALPQTPVRTALTEAFDWFRENGYLG